MSEQTQSVSTESELIPATTAARILGVSPSHFHELRKNGSLGPQPRKLGGVVRWSRQELLRWIKEGCPDAAVWKQRTK